MRDVVAGTQPSVGELLKTLVGETGVLVRQEITLASAEMTVKAKSVAMCASMIMVGAAVALAALLGAGATATIALGQIMPLWAACLCVTALWTVLSAVLVTIGLARLRAIDPLPQQTIASLRDVAKLPSRSPAAHSRETWTREETQ